MVSEKFWKFVFSNINADPSKLRLKYHGKDVGFDVEWAIIQIECRKKYAKKLTETLSANPRWLFPSILAGEQSTSDRLARYHASLINEGENIVDLTAGLGIDILHLSKKSAKATAVEIDAFKAEVLAQNLAATPVQTVNADCRDFLKARGQFDTMFIDPARRNAEGGRVYALTDCQPDVISLMPDIKSKAKRLIVKMSPMLDITLTLRQLHHTTRIIALGTETECKELIAIVEPHESTTASPIITAATIKNDGTIDEFDFTTEQEQDIDITRHISLPQPGDYLYDPYPAIMKAAPYKTIATRCCVNAISANTHLYHSSSLEDSFPGQKFIIEAILPYSSKHIKCLKKDYPRISVTTRNFDTTADTLRAKLGVNDSDTYRLYAATSADGGKHMLITRHI